MEPVHVIRHKHFAEGMSVRQIARELGLNRRTVQKYLAESEPRREESNPRPQPVLGPMAPRIEALLEEGVTVGERTVRRRQRAEVFIPLVHRPGDEAQVDFFEVLVDEGGVRRKVWKLPIRLMHSGQGESQRAARELTTPGSGSPVTEARSAASGCKRLLSRT